MRKHNGKQQEKAMKLWKRKIDEITVIITQKQKGQVLTILCVLNLRQNCKTLDILFLNIYKILN